jgi:hypothetical protein
VILHTNVPDSKQPSRPASWAFCIVPKLMLRRLGWDAIAWPSNQISRLEFCTLRQQQRLRVQASPIGKASKYDLHEHAEYATVAALQRITFFSLLTRPSHSSANAVYHGLTVCYTIQIPLLISRPVYFPHPSTRTARLCSFREFRNVLDQ